MLPPKKILYSVTKPKMKANIGERIKHSAFTGLPSQWATEKKKNLTLVECHSFNIPEIYIYT